MSQLGMHARAWYQPRNANLAPSSHEEPVARFPRKSNGKRPLGFSCAWSRRAVYRGNILLY